MDLTLRSILRQSLQIDCIVLVLSELEFPGGLPALPSRLRRLLGRAGGRIEILWTPDNKRSFKKLLPVVEKYPEATIITADDDVFYWRSWANALASAAQRFPGTIVGTRGTQILLTGKTVQPYLSWPHCRTDRPGHSIFLTGNGGILYPPGALDPTVQDWALASVLCPSADDIWFKAMATLAGTQAVRVNTGRDYPPNGATQAGALWVQNVGLDQNDEAFNKVVDYFHLRTVYAGSAEATSESS
ncbi:hypothetical protein IWX89_000423 [Cryobacterium sp. MP_M3]|uniref:hypothetical protein n=1 Tax=unclassified Cryobacterium TaxID=2649013 RepID=UPI0018C907EE|nr:MULTISPECIES: hypothetical protein [unclassified Cryobacterium]MBG6057005.1 hypothetical protein [Cryobacterium sp. MP_M3]